ncbi:hypothetical protein LR1_24370 [Lacticaseibacillus rhamnosus DSM 20021 = JCM 1136 = NBRC 3425]|nr:hypothetical protein LR1_24370 [Lacticaseibacillus rhamnosus DSM 20021 = JCM 1136 = NBRC 3425]
MTRLVSPMPSEISSDRNRLLNSSMKISPLMSVRREARYGEREPDEFVKTESAAFKKYAATFKSQP